jgi:hypothetical protein
VSCKCILGIVIWKHKILSKYITPPPPQIQIWCSARASFLSQHWHLCSGPLS